MSEMIERVAKAIFADRYPGEDWKDYQKRDYCGHARAAIEAMREPTEAMMAAVDCAGVKAEWLSGKAWAAGYRAMIDAALSEKP